VELSACYTVTHSRRTRSSPWACRPSGVDGSGIIRRRIAVVTKHEDLFPEDNTSPEEEAVPLTESDPDTKNQEEEKTEEKASPSKLTSPKKQV
jgi:hypothetical protein